MQYYILGVELLIVAPTEEQAQISIDNKFRNGLMSNENCAREIKNITKEFVEFKNGSKIIAKGVGRDGTGSNLLGNGKQFILVDEARLIDLPVVMTALRPMLATPRRIWGQAREKIGDIPYEKPKLILATSAWYREHQYYTDYFKVYYDEMKKDNPNYYAFSFDYKWAKRYLNFDIILEDKEKMTKEDFEREYGAKFLRQTAHSYFSSKSIKDARVMTVCERKQPKDSGDRYIIVHDVATADGGDNAITYVIKLIPRGDGMFNKEIVYIQSYNGVGVDVQAERLKYLFWECFPNAEKIIYDEQSAGQGIMPYFLTPYIKNGEEMPILIKEDDLETHSLLGSNCLPIVRGIKASEQYNLQHIPYVDTCLRNGTLKMLVPKIQTEQDFKDGLITQEEQIIFYETDMLEKELLNIARIIKPNGSFTFGKLNGRAKKDRFIALMYGLAYVEEVELEEVQAIRQKSKTNSWMDFGVF